MQRDEQQRDHGQPGRAIIDIGFSPNIPAEFIIFTLQQPVGQQVEV